MNRMFIAVIAVESAVKSYSYLKRHTHAQGERINIKHYYMAVSHKDWELPNSRI